jgi:hypothetical protein
MKEYLTINSNLQPVRRRDASSSSIRSFLRRGRNASLRHVFVSVLMLLSATSFLAQSKPVAKRTTRAIRLIVDRLRHDLSIRERVLVSIVARNEKLVSVERSKKRRGEFRLLIDEDFLRGLDDSEIRASIAHELGHVWIFTHHPYLQTELLANQIALRVVSRDDLERVYEKVWKEKTNLKEFLGEDIAVGLKPDIRVKPLTETWDRLTNK